MSLSSLREWSRKLGFDRGATPREVLHSFFHLMMKVAAVAHRTVYYRTRIARHFRAVRQSDVILEIGGGYNPTFTKDQYANVFHLDHCTAEALRAKYSSDPYASSRIDRIQHVDFVATGAPIDTLIPQDLKFDLVFSSHCIEHQVDFLAHLQAIEKMLKPDGRLMMVVPDYRHCFDALRFPTVTADVLSANLRRPRVHHGRQVFDATSRSIDLNPGRRVRGVDIAVARFTESLQSAYEAMMHSEVPGAEYRDAHAWAFCPTSFELIMLELRALQLTSLVPEIISGSYGNQFFVVLRPTQGEVFSGVENEGLLARKRLDLCRRLMR